jgi:hypothetical protein
VSEKDREASLQGALFRGDGSTAVAALSNTPNWDDVLQLAGDGLLVALAQHVQGAPDLARRCAEALRERDWEGDDNLAERLEATLELGPVPLLRPVPVDLEMLAGILEGDPAHGEARINLQTGDIWPQESIFDAETGEEDDEDPDRWLVVWSRGSKEGYRDMQDFIGTVTDEGRAERLWIAMSGRGAFRRFKDVLAGWPGEFDRWYTFSRERQRGRARAWLADHGYAPGPRPGSSLT